MQNRLKIILVSLAILIIAAVAIVYSVLSDRIPLNDSSVTGNLPGNLLNGGYFCELDGTVYFSNVSDSNTLYRMKPDESDFKRLGSMGVSQISGYGKFLYLFMDSSQYTSGKGLGYIGNNYGIYRCRIRDNKMNLMERCRPRTMLLCGSYLYFSGTGEDGDTGMYKLRIDKKDRKKLSDSMIMPTGYDGRYLFFAGAGGDPSVYYLNTPLNDMESRLFVGNVSSPIPVGDYIYFIDNAAGYRLCRYNRTTGALDRIGSERIDLFNTNGNYIWYATSADTTPALRRMRMDGSNVETIVEGVYNSIHVTSRFVYFAPYTEGGPTSMLHIPVNALGPVSYFSPPLGES